ncbi:hypothetical protein KRR38_15160 [Novosphingobium sp. G106]|nr:hypothetical protein [Novosphingobium sp. G106]MBV1688974.1 hypothetical protein [Novosphingobium sp. G106]
MIIRTDFVSCTGIASSRREQLHNWLARDEWRARLMFTTPLRAGKCVA